MHRRILFFALLLSTMHCYCQRRTVEPTTKLSYQLISLSKQTPEDSILVSVSVQNVDEFFRQQNNWSLGSHHASGNIFLIRVKLKDIQKLSLSENILFINEFHQPKEELTTGAADLTLNQINYAHARFPQLAGDSLQSS